MIDIDRLDTLDAVAPAAWNELVGDGSFYLSHQWLAAQDAGQPVDPVYLTARLDGRLVGALPTYLVHRETNEFYAPDRCADGRWTGRYLIAGARRAYTNDVLVAADLPADQRSAVTRALVAAALDRCAKHDLDGALFLYLGTEAAERLHQCAPSRPPVFATADAVVDLPGTGFDDYLAALPDKRRREVRREMARFATAGLAVKPLPVQPYWSQLADMFGAVQRRYGHGGDPQQWHRIVRRQTVRVEADAVILGCLNGGELVGGVLMFPWRGACYVKLCGFDYARLSGAFEYFNLVYYGVLRYAYDHGLSRAHFGREAVEAKLRRGARLAPLWVVEVPVREGSSGDAAYNAVQGRAWRAGYPWASSAFAERGWSMWGMSERPKELA